MRRAALSKLYHKRRQIVQVAQDKMKGRTKGKWRRSRPSLMFPHNFARKGWRMRWQGSARPYLMHFFGGENGKVENTRCHISKRSVCVSLWVKNSYCLFSVFQLLILSGGCFNYFFERPFRWVWSEKVGCNIILVGQCFAKRNIDRQKVEFSIGPFCHAMHCNGVTQCSVICFGQV